MCYSHTNLSDVYTSIQRDIRFNNTTSYFIFRINLHAFELSESKRYSYFDNIYEALRLILNDSLKRNVLLFLFVRNLMVKVEYLVSKSKALALYFYLETKNLQLSLSTEIVMRRLR